MVVLTLDRMTTRVLSSSEKPSVPVAWHVTFNSQAVLRRLIYVSPEISPVGLDSMIPSFTYTQIYQQLVLNTDCI